MSQSKNLFLVGGAKLLGLAVQFFTIRLFFDILGKTGFGVCSALVNLQRFVLLADLGLPESTNRQMAAAWASGDDQQGLRVWNTHKRIALVAGSLMVVIYGLLSLFYPLHQVELGTSRKVLLFLLAGIYTALTYGIYTYGSWFSSRRQFGPVATAALWMSVGGATLSAGLVWWLRSQEAYFIGFSTGAALGLLSLYRRRRQELSSRSTPSFDPDVFKEAKRFGIRALANKLSGAIGNGADRIIIHQQLGEGAIGVYNVSARAPEAAADALPLYQIISPELVGAHAKGPEQFSRAIDSSLRTALLVGICGILVPCAFGFGFLPYLLGRSFDATLPWVMAGIGAYRMFETLYSAVAVIIYANGNPEKIIPFTLWNGFATLFLSLPAVTWRGLEGIVIMNLGIMVLQFVPLLRMTLRTCAPDLPRRALLTTFALMIGVGTGIGLGAFEFARYAYGQGIGWVSLLTAPLFSGLTLLVLVKTKLAKAPEFLARRVPFLR
ncbi:MAG: oligosaccharide flippase family protein [Chthonomonas sp.]|nr:oligosaccharide flippase family protein [Chthonomonas sp.]